MLLLLTALLTVSSLDAQEESAPRIQTQRRVLYIGDSITDGGWGNSGGDMRPSSERSEWDKNHIYGHGYMEQCASYYQATYPDEEMVFWNRGISGNTLEQMVNRWHGDALALNPNVISILIGTNDIHNYLEQKQKNQEQKFDYTQWEQSYRQLLDMTLDSLPDVKLVLCTPFVAKAGWVGEAENYHERENSVAQLAEIVRQIANDYHAILVPFDQLFVQLRNEHPTSNNSYWIWDGIHPTPAGHYKMAELWKEKAGDTITQ